MAKRLPLLVLILLLALAAMHISYFASRLPPTVASHFNGAGTANGWMSRESFLLTYGILMVVLTTPFLLLGPLLKIVPDRFVNLPNKAHWLHPSRRAQTHDYLQQWALWFCNVTVGFHIFTMHQAIRTNLEPVQRLSSASWTSFIVFLCFLVAMITALLVRFRKPRPFPA